MDHAMIFVLIAGTYTPFSLLGLLGSASTFLLILSWSLAGLGSILTIFWYDQPKWLIAVLYIAVGWVAVFSFGPLLSAIGLGGLALVVAGGVLYSVGALIYGFRRPDPHPRIFGYHEVFHAFVLAGAGAHFLAIFLRVPL
ncbi:MAG: PAQR family membrane homeostasis protein TrhA [Planctomycetota bacterium]